MARYIDEILQPGEKILYSTTVHWIFYTPGILAWIVAIVGWIMERPRFDWRVLKSRRDAEVTRLEGIYDANLIRAGQVIRFK